LLPPELPPPLEALFSLAFILVVHSSNINNSRPLVSTVGEVVVFYLHSTTHKWSVASSMDSEFRLRRVSIEIATCSGFFGIE
jgi:hypothetical protein